MPELIFSIIISILYTISCIFLGLFILKYIKNDDPFHYKLVNAFIIGLGIFTFVFIFIGLLHLFSYSIIFTIILLILSSGLYIFRSNFKNIELTPIYNWFKTSIILKILFTILLLITGIRAVIFQPLGDSAAYYMVLPKLIASLQYITPLPGYELFGQTSLFNELHYAALISLGGTFTAKFFIWIVFLSAIILLFQIGDRIGIKLYGKYILLTLLLTSFAFTDLIFGATVDWFAAAFGLAAFIWTLKSSYQNQKTPLVLAGFLSGLAVIGKISYIYTFLPGILILIYWTHLSKITISRKSLNLFKEQLKPMIKTGLIFGCGILIPVIMNVLKNYILFHQPLAPFISSDSTGLNQIWYTPENALWITITYPFALVFGTYPMQGGTLSPLFLAFLPFILLIPDKKPEFNKIMICSILGIIISIIITPYIFAPRYLMVPLLLLMVIIAISTEYILNHNSTISIIILIFIIAITFITLLSSLSVISSTINNGECIMIGPICNASQIINTQASNNDRVTLLGSYSYWLNNNFIVNLSSTMTRKDLQKFTSSYDRIKYLYDKNFTYIYFDGNYGYKPDDFINNTQDITTIKIFEEGKAVIIKIHPTATF
jgi:hypothetical protein